MKLYEINQAIEDLISSAVDPETGEILMDTEALDAQLFRLEMDRKSILQYLAKLTLNVRSEAAVLKTEEERLKARRAALGKEEERLMAILNRECAGEKTDLIVATISYRKTSHLDVTDAPKAVRWLKRHKYMDCFRVPSPEVAKNEVRKLINAGTKVPGCAVVEDLSCSLK